jgi:membrane protease YdiL (CAAX protease family)
MDATLKKDFKIVFLQFFPLNILYALVLLYVEDYILKLPTPDLLKIEKSAVLFNFLIIGIVSPFIETFVFQLLPIVMLMGIFSNYPKWNSQISIFVSVLLWFIAHYSQDTSQAINVLPLGIVLSYFFHRNLQNETPIFQSFFGTFAIHFAWNTLMLCLIYVFE